MYKYNNYCIKIQFIATVTHAEYVHVTKYGFYFAFINGFFNETTKFCSVKKKTKLCLQKKIVEALLNLLRDQ